jgi:hypothetical protein
MLFYITGGAPQAVPGTACVEANRTACIEDTCSSVRTPDQYWTRSPKVQRRFVRTLLRAEPLNI